MHLYTGTLIQIHATIPEKNIPENLFSDAATILNN